MYKLHNPHGCTVTIFAPYDCGNNCDFCVNKKDYKKYKSDFEAVLESIRKIHQITPSCDFAITGGEPFADIAKLRIMLDYIGSLRGGSAHNIYINTTLPRTVNNQKLIGFTKAYKHMVNCLNVSRNIYVTERDYYSHDIPYDTQSTENIFDDLEIPVRINCTIDNKKDCGYLVGKVSKYLRYPIVQEIQFREDYTKVNEDNLHQGSPTFLKTVEEVNSFLETPEEYCGINLNGFKLEQIRWNYKIGLVYADRYNNSPVETLLTYHKTLPYSKVDGYLNDIIIRQDGVILDDWNDYGEELDLYEYRKAVRETKSN